MAGDLGTLRLTLEADVNKLNTGIDTAKTKISSLSSVFKSGTQESMAFMFGLQSLGLALGSIGAIETSGIVLAVKEFANFEEQMKNVQSISQGTKQDFDELSQFAMKLGKDTVFSSKEAAQALYYMASAGYSAKESMQATGAVLTLATATQYDLARASEFVATTITSFGLKASDAGKIADVMAVSVGKSQATMEKLGYSLPYVATTAHMLGMSLEETVAALSLLYDGGLRGEMAGERLRGALNDLLNPTDKAKDALAKLGLTVDQVNPSTKSLVEIVGAFQKTSFTASDAAKIFGERAEGMSILVQQGADKLKNLTTELNNSAGAAQKMADIQKEALAKSFEQLKGSIENLQIKMGEGLSPQVKRLTEYLEGLVDTLADMPKDQLQIITTLIALGGAMTTVTGASMLFVAQLPNVIAGLTALGGGALMAGIGALSVAMGTLGGVLTAFAVDPLVKANEKALLLEYGFKSLQQSIEKAKEQGLDPYKMSIGELITAEGGLADEIKNKVFPAFGDFTNITLAEVEQALVAHYGTNVKVIDLYKIMSEKVQGLSKDHKLLNEDLANFATDTDTGAEALNKLITHMGSTTTATGILKDSFEKQVAVLGLTKTGMDSVSDANKQTIITLDDLTKGASQTQEGLTKVFEKIISGIGTYKEAYVQNADGIMVKTGEFVGNIRDTTKLGLDDVDARWRDSGLMQLKAVGDTYAGIIPIIRDTQIEVSGYAFKMTEDRITADQEATDFAIRMQVVRADNEKKDNELRINAVKETNEQVIIEEEAFNEWAKNNQEFLIGANKIKYATQYKDMLQFQASELDSYKLQREAIEKEYEKQKKNAELFGEDVVEIEKWKNDQILQLQIKHVQQYGQTVSNFMTSLSNSYIGLVELFGNSEMTKEEIQNSSLIRFTTWINKQVDLIKNLTAIYYDLSKMLTIVNTLAGTNIDVGGGLVLPMVGFGQMMKWYDEAKMKDELRTQGSIDYGNAQLKLVKEGEITQQEAELNMLKQQYEAGYKAISWMGQTYRREELPALIKWYEDELAKKKAELQLLEIEDQKRRRDAVQVEPGTKPKNIGMVDPLTGIVVPESTESVYQAPSVNTEISQSLAKLKSETGISGIMPTDSGMVAFSSGETLETLKAIEAKLDFERAFTSLNNIDTNTKSIFEQLRPDENGNYQTSVDLLADAILRSLNRRGVLTA